MVGRIQSHISRNFHPEKTTLQTYLSQFIFSMNFNELHLIDPLLKALEEEGYHTPTPIQAEAIPSILNQQDILGCAQTGTGKTAAFALPILQLLSAVHINDKKKKIRCLILTPTRELAIQIEDNFKAYGRHTTILSTVIFGGVGQQPQIDRLNKGIDVLIATPGRLLDLIHQGFIHLNHLEIFVLDEADRMLDMGFVHDVKRVLKLIPERRQSLFFSATMPEEIIQLANTILHNPIKIEVTPISSTADTVEQYIYFVNKKNKNELLREILKDKNIRRVLVFTRTKHGADKVVKYLLKYEITAEAIHGNKAQNARQRALNNFKSHMTRVLVATDIAARGIDVDDLEYVINYDIPNEAETYVHRIGRTGRAGAQGMAFSFCDTEEKPYLKGIEKLIAKKIPVIQEHSFPLVNEEPVLSPYASGTAKSNRDKSSKRRWGKKR